MRAVVQWFRSLIDRWDAFVTHQSLMELDERTLKDIGLDRDDL